jgi:hypothetical protein
MIHRDYSGPAAERLLDAALSAPACRWGHGPLTGWRARPSGRRGRYCLACNVDANRRSRARHRAARAPHPPKADRER